MNSGYGYFVPGKAPTPPTPRRKGRGWMAMRGAVAAVVAAVATYVMLQRLDDQVLTIIATIGCAGGIALPGLLVALVVLVRRAEGNGRREVAPQQPQMMQPTIMFIPPMAMPQYPQVQGPQPAVWDSRPVERRFTVVGGGNTDWED